MELNYYILYQVIAQTPLLILVVWNMNVNALPACAIKCHAFIKFYFVCIGFNERKIFNSVQIF